MNHELQNKLFQKFPNLFIEKDLPMTQTCMCWGIETGNGWFNLLWDLCEKLNFLTKDVIFEQIKSKFGGLRVYYKYAPKLQLRYNNFRKEYYNRKSKLYLRGLNSQQKRKLKRIRKTIDYLILEAERIAFKTCEYCGNNLQVELDKDEGYWFAKECEKCK